MSLSVSIIFNLVQLLQNIDQQLYTINMERSKHPKSQLQSADNIDYSQQGISTAFRKLLRRVTTQKNNLCQKKNTSRISFSSFHSQLLLKKRKNSISLFQNRRAPYLSNSLNFNQSCNVAEPIQRPYESEINRKFNQSPFRSVRCHSNPSSVKNSNGNINKSLIHDILQARTYHFQFAKPAKSVKYALTDIFFSKKQSDDLKNGENFKYKIKYGQKRRQFNNIVKGRQVSVKTKTENAHKQCSWQPWQSDKIEQFFFVNH